MTSFRPGKKSESLERNYDEKSNLSSWFDFGDALFGDRLRVLPILVSLMHRRMM